MNCPAANVLIAGAANAFVGSTIATVRPPYGWYQ